VHMSSYWTWNLAFVNARILNIRYDSKGIGRLFCLLGTDVLKDLGEFRKDGTPHSPEVRSYFGT
jgi:hypothetical protein